MYAFPFGALKRSDIALIVRRQVVTQSQKRGHSDGCNFEHWNLREILKRPRAPIMLSARGIQLMHNAFNDKQN